MRITLRPIAAAAAALVLAGCASVNIDQTLQDTNQATQAFTQGQLELSQSAEQHATRRALSQQLLAQPLSSDDAVRLALANSPAVQTLLAQSWASQSAALQSGQMANPVFSFERLRTPDELDIGRMLSFGLLDLLTLPQRMGRARSQAQQLRTQLAVDVIDQVTQIRQAWVRAVAAQQNLQYAEQVKTSAEAGAELARRMQQVGNFSRLQRVSQHAFYADAVAQLASAQHATTAAREELIRQLGLDDAQAALLRLPERLPDLPKTPRQTVDISAAAQQQRLDVQLARQQLQAVDQAHGLNLLNSLVDVEISGIRNTTFDKHAGQKTTTRGYELGIRLPIFDWGSAQRDGMNAQALAAASRYDGVVRSATSQLRESYSAYRTAYGLARHYHDAIVPLRQIVAEENMLRYNGMFISVFELLAGQREQVSGVMAAIQAQQQFWLADAALAATLMGKPATAAAAPVASAGAAAPAGH